MKLLHIKATTQVDKVNLIIDNYLIPFPVDKLSFYHLTSDQEISPEFLNQLLLESYKFLLTNYGLRLIGMNPQTAKTLTTKLKIYFSKLQLKSKLKPNIIRDELLAEIVKNLIDRNLVNTQEYAKYLVNKHRRKSRQEIIYRLKNAGVDQETIDAALPSDDESQLENIRRLVYKKLKSHTDLTDLNTKNKLIASLVRRGFTLSLVKTVIDEIRQNR